MSTFTFAPKGGQGRRWLQVSKYFLVNVKFVEIHETKFSFESQTVSNFMFQWTHLYLHFDLEEAKNRKWILFKKRIINSYEEFWDISEIPDQTGIHIKFNRIQMCFGVIAVTAGQIIQSWLLRNCICVFFYLYLGLWMSDTWEHCFWGPWTISFSKIYHILVFFQGFPDQSYKWIGIELGWIGMGRDGNLCGVILWAPLCGANKWKRTPNIRLAIAYLLKLKKLVKNGDDKNLWQEYVNHEIYDKMAHLYKNKRHQRCR